VAKLLHPLLLLLARATEPEMVRMIEYLKAENRSLSEFLCQPSGARYLLVSSGKRPSNRMAKWFNASFQCRTGIVHRADASRIAM
jgi:hypothetical protein